MNDQKLPENGTVLENATVLPKRSPLFDLKQHDAIFAFAFIALGWVYYNLFGYILEHGVGLLIFTILYVSLIGIYAKTKGVKCTKESLIWLCILLGLAISHLLYKNDDFYGLDTLAAHLAAVYWTMCRCGALIDGKIGKWVWLEGLRGLFYHPFRCFFAPIIAVKRAASERLNKSNKKSAMSEIAIGVVILVPVLMIVLPNLYKADASFAEMLKSIFYFQFKSSFDFILQMFISFMVGSYLFGLAFSCAGFNHDRFNQKCNAAQNTARIMPINSIKTVFYVISAIYILFVINSIASATMVFSAGIPQGYSYSSYAREGFFEMCWVAAFTLLLIGISVWISKESWQESFHLRLASVLLSVCSIGIICTAMAKMILYISERGLTPLRLFTTVFMVFLLMVFVLIIISTKRSIDVPHVAGLVFGIGFTVLTLINVSGVIAHYNTSRYIDGTLQNETLEGIGFYKGSDETLSQIMLFNSLEAGSDDKKEMGWQLYNRHRRIDNSGDIFCTTVSDAIAYYNTSHYEQYSEDKS